MEWNLSQIIDKLQKIQKSIYVLFDGKRKSQITVMTTQDKATVSWSTFDIKEGKILEKGDVEYAKIAYEQNEYVELRKLYIEESYHRANSC